MPEPILVAIAAALAGKGMGNLYDLVRRKFAGRPEATAALEAAVGAAPESPEVQLLSRELEHAEQSDPRFAVDLRAMWTTVSATGGGVASNFSGHAGGNVVQARDIQGGVSF